MNHEELLLENVEAKKHCIGSYIDNKIRIKDNLFNAKSLYKIIEHLKWMKENEIKYDLKIIIDSKNIADQVIVLALESIIYYALKEWNLRIKINLEVTRGTIGYYCFLNSLLYKFIGNTINNKAFIDGYEKKKTIERTKYRRICNDKAELPEIVTEVTMFLENLGIVDDDSDDSDISIMVSEIVENAFTHSNSPCIFSIIVLNSRTENKKMVDIAILDYSKIYLGDGIKKYVLNENVREDYSKHNKIVLDAYNNHKKHFNDTYTIDDFCMVSVFQKSVTSRRNSFDSSGTGLTTLIKTLIDKSIFNYCYASSGNTNILFTDEFLKLSEEGLIGFNESNDYITEIPSKRVLLRNEYNLNINAFSLEFIFKGELSYERGE